MAFDTNYPQNMWEGTDANQRDWYSPMLYPAFVRNTVYNNYVTQQFDLSGVRAMKMYVDGIISPQPNHNPIGFREAWGETSHIDSYRREIGLSRYYGKLSINKHEQARTFWDGGRSEGSLAPVIMNELAPMMAGTLEKVARDAFMQMPFHTYKANLSGSSFNDIAADDYATSGMVRDVLRAVDNRETMWANVNEAKYPSAICITSGEVISDIRDEIKATPGSGATWREVNQYTDAGRAAIISGEVGEYEGVRYVKNPGSILWNTGAITNQTTMTAPRLAGDGAPDPETTKVDGIEMVGQKGATHSIAVAELTGLTVGKMVTIHKLRTNANGVTNGVDYRDGSACTRRIVARSGASGAGTIQLDRPIMENFDELLAASTYGYVTLARNVYSMLFIYMPDGVVRGVQQAPKVYFPQPVDDFDQILRASWDSVVGYTPFNKNSAEVAFVTSRSRVNGAMI